MKITQSVLILLAIFVYASCSSKKKSTAAAPVPTTSNTNSAPTSTVAAAPMLLARPANGVYSPGQTELDAILVKHADATLAQLQQGYTIYSKGACIGCHNAKNIYRPDDIQWEGIIGDMAMRAHLTSAEKEAVYRYVKSVRAAR